MKIVVFGNDRRVGALAGERVVDLNRASSVHGGQSLPADLLSFIEGGPRAIDAAQTVVERALTASPQGGANDVVLALNGLKLHAPRAAHSRIACAGGNYARHAAGARRASGQQVTDEEVFQSIKKANMWGFWKMNHQFLTDGDSIPYPARTTQLDYEGEIAVVLSCRGEGLSAVQAKDAIWGVMLFNDVSVRGGGDPNRGMSFNLAKNFDGSTSFGPCIVVGELDPQALQVKTTVNGETRQDYNTNEMVHSFADGISYLSRDFTFIPGDILSGGTGPGTAIDSSEYVDGVPKPDKFLKPGDVMEVSNPSIGVLRNTIVAKG